MARLRQVDAAPERVPERFSPRGRAGAEEEKKRMSGSSQPSNHAGEMLVPSNRLMKNGPNRRHSE